MEMIYHVMSSPLGLLFLAGSERGLRYVDFMDRKSIKRMIARHAKEVPVDTTWAPSLLGLKSVVDQLDDYFCGTLSAFDVKLDIQSGTPFQRSVWKALQRIPYAETRSYGQVAKMIHQPRAARAVGLANNSNPIPIIVPCHRVIGADGSLAGYGGGVQRKRTLLQLEARFGKLEAVAGAHSGWRGN